MASFAGKYHACFGIFASNACKEAYHESHQAFRFRKPRHPSRLRSGRKPRRSHAAHAPCVHFCLRKRRTGRRHLCRRTAWLFLFADLESYGRPAGAAPCRARRCGGGSCRRQRNGRDHGGHVEHPGSRRRNRHRRDSLRLHPLPSSGTGWRSSASRSPMST